MHFRLFETYTIYLVLELLFRTEISYRSLYACFTVRGSMTLQVFSTTPGRRGAGVCCVNEPLFRYNSLNAVKIRRSEVHRTVLRGRLGYPPHCREWKCVAGASADGKEDEIPPNCARYTVNIPKPLGLVMEETASGLIRVAEILSGGNAERTGLIQLGDVLIATSGNVKTTERYYGEVRVQGGEKRVRILCKGETFDTVMAAIGSHLASDLVSLEFQRCED